MSNVVEEGTSEETVTRTVAEILNEGAEWHAQLQAKAAAHRQQQLENIQAEMQKVADRHAEAPEEPLELTPDRLSKLIDGIKASLIIHAATKHYTEFSPFDCVWNCAAAKDFVDTVTAVDDLLYVDLVDGKTFQFHIPELPFANAGTIPYSMLRNMTLRELDEQDAEIRYQQWNANADPNEAVDDSGARRINEANKQRATAFVGLICVPEAAQKMLQHTWDRSVADGTDPARSCELVLTAMLNGGPEVEVDLDEDAGLYTIMVMDQGTPVYLHIFTGDTEDENDEA